MWLPQMHTKRTRQNVESFIEAVMMWKHVEHVRRETAMTPNYVFRDYASNSGISKPVEDAAIDNAEYDRAMQREWERLERALSTLPPEEYVVIESRYMRRGEREDGQVCNELHISESTYRRRKVRAISKIALALRIEEWVNPNRRKRDAAH